MHGHTNVKYLALSQEVSDRFS